MLDWDLCLPKKLGSWVKQEIAPSRDRAVDITGGQA
jgi:hypothetical protein